ncbi:hypothetical protein FB446DRAFT_821411 [Lentinula raphanica]|nr:hypothetical protein FB446DRAFT_821411 [Lentinula raphanica]
MSFLPGLSLGSNRNKLRICVALYWRNSQFRNDDSCDSYHSAILLVPKSIPMVTGTTWRFHAINDLRSTIYGGQEIFWSYEPSHTALRTSRLLALVFLGKLSPDVSPGDLDAIFHNYVPVIQNDPTYTCNTWTRSAIQVMKNQGIIDAPIPPEMIMANGERFADNFELVHSLPVPTCDIYGQSIDSLVKTLLV